MLTIITYAADTHTMHAVQIDADAASGDLVFLGTPTNREIRNRANELLAAPESGDYQDAAISWEKTPVLSTGQWLCEACGGVCDEADGYAETASGYLCETCAEESGVNLDNCP